jgi:hypothetical protein
MTSDLGFKVDAAQFDRDSIIREAATLIDAGLGHLGPTGRLAESDEGRLTRALAADEARLPAYPDVFRITDEDFLAQHKPQPVAIRELADKFSFYWVRFPIGLRPQIDWAFNMIEMDVEFGIGQPASLRPKAYRILPDKRFQDLLKANMTLELKLNEDLQFETYTGKVSASAGPATATGSAGVGGGVNAGAGAVFGPFQYSVKKAKIDHSAPGLEKVFWRLDGAEFFQEDVPELITILQMPKELAECEIHAKLQAYRYFNFGAAPWQRAIAQIPAMLRRFFEVGMPLRDEKRWDIKPSL